MKTYFSNVLVWVVFARMVKRIDLFEMWWLNNIQESNYVQVVLMFPSLPSFEKLIQNLNSNLDERVKRAIYPFT